MAIPGSKPEYDVRAKVRIGKKAETRTGKEYPTSVDYFICDDEEFGRVVGEGKSELRIFFAHQRGDEAFKTGLEQWAGSMQVCFADGAEEDGTFVAFRKASMKQRGREVNLLDGFDVLSDRVIGNDRRKVECRVRDCPMMKSKDCKPMGRLRFYIDGIGKDGGVYQLDTKSWHSIENVEKTLNSYTDLRGIPFVLRVSFTQEGDKRFPELTLEAENVVVNTPEDVALADALLQLRGALERGELETEIRPRFAAALDLSNPGWRERQDFIDRIKAVGPVEAAKGLLTRYEL